MTFHKITMQFWLVASATLLSVGCSGNKFVVPQPGTPNQPTGPAAATLLITGVSPLTTLGQSIQLHASETLDTGIATDVTASALWQITPAGSFTVSVSGLVTCVGDGTAQVSVSKDNASANVKVACTINKPSPVPPPTLLISGTTTLAGVGATSQLQVTESLGNSPPNDVTASSLWQATPAGILAVGPSGLVSCLSLGTATITANKDNASSSIPITCSVNFTALALSQQFLSLRVGTPTSIRAIGSTVGQKDQDVTAEVAWAAGSPIASISTAGVVSCFQAGETTLSASLSALTKTIPLVCSPSSWTSPSYFMEQSDDFAGPFPSWINVKTYGAVGDGVHDDTASIQAALDKLGTSLKYTVLWFPKGIYLVTAQLHIDDKSYFSVIGEDPRTTMLLWGGRPGGTMLAALGSTYFRITRLGFDGHGIADLAEQITTLDTDQSFHYTTFVDLSDQHIYGVKNGIALTVSAETTIERVFFDHLSGFGVQTGNPNVLNIFINDSLFVKNGIGVTNWGGAGSFIVSNSFFSQSATADMAIANTCYYTSRHNTSVGSKVFFLAGMIGANPSMITLQNNTVLDPVGIPFQLGDQGPMMLIDNVVRMQDPALPAIMGFDDNTVSRSVFSFGNTFTTALPPVSGAGLPFQGTVVAYDDSIVDPSTIPDVKIPDNVYVPPNLHRPIYEVPLNATGADIQGQISNAISAGDLNAVVHVPTGYYHVVNPLVVPNGTDMELIGDDSIGTTLSWDGSGAGPALQVDSDSVSLKGFRVKRGAGSLVDGIRIPVPDQPTSQVIVDQALLQFGNSLSVSFAGLEHATAELFSTYTLGSKTGVNVFAGPYRAAKLGALGVTNFYTGSAQSGGSGTSFNVSSGGKLLVQDNWHDGGSTSSQNFILSGSGTLTEQVGMVAMNSANAFEIDDFDGKVSLIGLQVPYGNITTHPGKSSTQLLSLGMDGSTPDYLTHSEGNLFVSNVLNEYYGSKGGQQLPNGALPTVEWLRGMLAQTRSEYPLQRLPMVTGLSRKRLERIQVEGFNSAIQILPKAVPNQLYYTLAVRGDTLNSGSKGMGACSGSSVSGSGVALAWRLLDAGDGDYILADTTGATALGTVSNSAALSLTARDSQYDQRWIIQDVGDGRKSLQNRATTGMLAWTPGSCPRLVPDASSDAAKWTLTAN